MVLVLRHKRFTKYETCIRAKAQVPLAVQALRAHENSRPARAAQPTASAHPYRALDRAQLLFDCSRHRY